jgi:hypothetical protein
MIDVRPPSASQQRIIDATCYTRESKCLERPLKRVSSYPRAHRAIGAEFLVKVTRDAQLRATHSRPRCGPVCRLKLQRSGERLAAANIVPPFVTTPRQYRAEYQQRCTIGTIDLDGGRTLRLACHRKRQGVYSGPHPNDNPPFATATIRRVSGDGMTHIARSWHEIGVRLRKHPHVRIDAGDSVTDSVRPHASAWPDSLKVPGRDSH